MVIHCTYGAAAVAIVIDAGPCHAPPVRVDTVDWKELAAEPNWAANASHAAAAAHIEPERGPAYIRAELISGGKSTKSGNILTPPQPGRRPPSPLSGGPQSVAFEDPM
ncbi:hypothetical protein A5758_21355 [Mycobacterium sp. 852014-50255_SCH5639931]|nr:hypothetical protein A5758_21355 [Mycobacterium sp. 852014-50255_SCH5639931]